MADGPSIKVPDAARELGVTEETIRRWLRLRKLHGARPGGDKAGWRIPRSEIERLLTEVA